MNDHEGGETVIDPNVPVEPEGRGVYNETDENVEVEG